MSGRKVFKPALLLCGAMLGTLYLVEWLPGVTKRVTIRAPYQTTNVVGTGTNAMTPAVRAGIEAALHHVRDEMAHAAANDLEMLKGIEATLTNVLARP